jgi:histone deacetylase 1/2
MKPHRIRITHDLVSAYNMLDKMHVLVCRHSLYLKTDINGDDFQRPKRAAPEVMSSFHTDEYVHFLNRVTPETAEDLTYHGTRCE